MRIAELAGRRVAIWGYGREGRAAHQALRKRLSDLPLTVWCSLDEAAALVAAGDARLVAHSNAPTAADLSAFDVVIKSPGISAYKPELIEAERNGTRFTSGTSLWFAENPAARVIAVTGTKGKSTTTALIAHLLRRMGKRVALAGNIGLPLLELLDQQADAWVIELSSFQTRSAGAVDVAVINNIHEEHLDWHGDRDRYVDDKLALAKQADTLVLNALQPALQPLGAAHANTRWFGNTDGWHVAKDGIARGERLLLASAELPLAGPHNALNVCAALTAIEAFGADAGAAVEHVAGFRPLPHRLTDLGWRDGLRWIDDSIATTPQATLEGLASLRGKAVVVLVGGHDRGLDWTAFVAAMQSTPPAAIVTMGANGPRIARQLREAQVDCVIGETATLADAVMAARRLAVADGVILLSPGAPSFDQFRDYAERGRVFAGFGGFDGNLIGDIEGLGISDSAT